MTERPRRPRGGVVCIETDTFDFVGHAVQDARLQAWLVGDEGLIPFSRVIRWWRPIPVPWD